MKVEIEISDIHIKALELVSDVQLHENLIETAEYIVFQYLKGIRDDVREKKINS